MLNPSGSKMWAGRISAVFVPNWRHLPGQIQYLLSEKPKLDPIDSHPGRRSSPCNRAVKADPRWLNQFQKNHRESKRVLFIHSFLVVCFEFRFANKGNQLSNYLRTGNVWIVVCMYAGSR